MQHEQHQTYVGHVLPGCAVQFSAPAHALPNESCFESRLDYEIYQVLEDGVTSNPGDEIILEESWDSWMKRAKEHGPSRKKPVTINVVEKNDSSGGMFQVDASTSTTASGKIRFEWVPPASADAKTGQSAKLQISQGSRSAVEIKVTDPECEISGSRTIAVPKR